MLTLSYAKQNNTFSAETARQSYLIHTPNYLELSSISRIWHVNQVHILNKSPSMFEGHPTVF